MDLVRAPAVYGRPHLASPQHRCAPAAQPLQDARPVEQNTAVAEVTHASPQRRARRCSSSTADDDVGDAADSDSLWQEKMQNTAAAAAVVSRKQEFLALKTRESGLLKCGGGVVVRWSAGGPTHNGTATFTPHHALFWRETNNMSVFFSNEFEIIRGKTKSGAARCGIDVIVRLQEKWRRIPLLLVLKDTKKTEVPENGQATSCASIFSCDTGS